MDKGKLTNLVEEGRSIRQIASVVNLSPTTIRYWLKKYGLKTKSNYFVEGDEGGRLCGRCGEKKEREQFYREGKNSNRPQGYCKTCSNKYTIERQRRIKRSLLDYKGGKCEKCGYKKCDAALEFHHKDPTKKDFHISKYKNKEFNKTIKKELDKCMLLCANCHREAHNEF